jgi:hypothetical protein
MDQEGTQEGKSLRIEDDPPLLMRLGALPSH